MVPLDAPTSSVRQKDARGDDNGSVPSEECRGCGQAERGISYPGDGACQLPALLFLLFFLLLLPLLGLVLVGRGMIERYSFPTRVRSGAHLG